MLKLTNVTDLYKNAFAKQEQRMLDGNPRRVGIEAEYALVSSRDSDFGHAIKFPQLELFFESLMEKHPDLKPTHDPVTKKILELNGNVNDVNFGLGPEFGACTLEVRMEPNGDLKSAGEEVDTVLSEIVPVAEENDFYILGYGIQPITPPHIDLVPPKGRQKALNKRFWTTEKLTAPNTDVQFHTINAAAQVHVDIGTGEEMKAVNVFNTYAPAMAALFANSQVWKGRVDLDYIEPREKFWDWVVNVPQDMHRKGIAPRFKDLEQYVHTSTSFQPIMTMRDGEFLEFYGTTSYREYLHKGRAQVIVPGTSSDPQIPKKGSWITPEDIDIHISDSFDWWEARVRCGQGTLEVRPCSQQPKEDGLALPALSLGLVNNIDEALPVLNEYTIEEVIQGRESAIKHGLNGQMGRKHMYVVAKEMLDLACRGLEPTDAKLLRPLYDRVESKKTLSEEASELFRTGGVDKLVERYRIAE